MQLGSSSLVWERADRDMDNEEVVMQAGRLWPIHQGVKLNLQYTPKHRLKITQIATH